MDRDALVSQLAAFASVKADSNTNKNIIKTDWGGNFWPEPTPPERKSGFQGAHKTVNSLNKKRVFLSLWPNVLLLRIINLNCGFRRTHSNSHID